MPAKTVHNKAEKDHGRGNLLSAVGHIRDEVNTPIPFRFMFAANNSRVPKEIEGGEMLK